VCRTQKLSSVLRHCVNHEPHVSLFSFRGVCCCWYILSPLPASTYESVFAINNMQHRAPLNHYQQRPSLLLLLTAAVSPSHRPLSIYHSIYLIHDDTIFNIDCRSFSFINMLVDTSALSSLPYRLINVIHLINGTTPSTQQPPAKSDMSTSNTSPLCHLQRPPNCLPKRLTILLRRSHLHGNPSLR